MGINGIRKPPRAIACIKICVHVNDSVVYARVWWIMETLKHPACTVRWVAQLCRSWLSPGKATRISHERNPIGTMHLFKKKYNWLIDRLIDWLILNMWCPVNGECQTRTIHRSLIPREISFTALAHEIWCKKVLSTHVHNLALLSLYLLFIYLF